MHEHIVNVMDMVLTPNTCSPRRDRFGLPKSIGTVTTCSGLDGLDSPVEVLLGEDVQEMRIGTEYSSTTSAVILEAPSGAAVLEAVAAPATTRKKI